MSKTGILYQNSYDNNLKCHFMQLWGDTASLPILPDSPSLSGSTASLQSPGMYCDIFIHAPGATQENAEQHVREESSRNPQELVRMFPKRLPALQGIKSHSMLVSCYKTACKQGCRNAYMEVPNHKAVFQP